jgi:Holliday junction resolvase RusA-like endonuclease
MVEANKRLGMWQQTLSDLMAQEAPRTPIYAAGCPVALYAYIYLPRPKSHYLKSGQIRPAAPTYPTVKPDLSKVMRAIEDAGTGIWWDDDRQITLESIAKLYAREIVGVAIWCRKASSEEMCAMRSPSPSDSRRWRSPSHTRR